MDYVSGVISGMFLSTAVNILMMVTAPSIETVYKAFPYINTAIGLILVWINHDHLGKEESNQDKLERRPKLKDHKYGKNHTPRI